MKIYAASDLHADYPENLEWVRSLEGEDLQADLLILAGDISDRWETLREVLARLVSSFRAVCYVPGNHELWLREEDPDCSLEKFHAVQALCEELGVVTGVYRGDGFSVVPLLSWYDFSFGEPDRYLRRAWRDFRRCRWPDELGDDPAVSEFFLSRNSGLLDVRDDTVISFSHFLPTLAVMPDRIPMDRRRVYPVLGSEALGEQLRELGPDIHVYGHSHVNRDVEIEGIRYVNNAFAYPRETRIARKRLYCIWEQAA